MKRVTSSSEHLRRPSSDVACPNETQYWAEDHDAKAWSAKFRRLVSDAHGSAGGKKNKRALAAYREMRLDVESQTRRMISAALRRQSTIKAPLGATMQRPGSHRDGGAAADPLAVASYLGCALLLPIRHYNSSADGDLESQCRRRCHGHIPLETDDEQRQGKNGIPETFDRDLAVVRGTEHYGYPALSPGEAWSLRAVGYSHPRSERLPSLRIAQGQKALEDRLFRALESATERRELGGCLVLAGVPFCRGGDEDAHRAAEVTVRALARAGIKTVVLAGQNAGVSAKLFQSALSGLPDDSLSVSLWQGEK
mmetsp:Transcript_3324/g.8594  ORF Transcript_3324/g.8594 Transcript_3324/m.8594 type:complete len:310 (-) Transcript_3324:211-1140(-)